MNNLEEKLNKIKVRKISDGEKNSIWLGIITKRESYQEAGVLSIFNFKKHMIGAFIALAIILGGSGAVAASNAAVPGDALYGLDLAFERVKLNMVSDAEKKDELRVKFADERVAEARMKSDVNGSANTRDLDLSGANVTEIEVDVFTNETTVKIEANDRHYGFVTAKKIRAEVVAEIAAKYNLAVSKVDAMIDFETEDRASRAEDKEFLNSSNSVGLKIESEKEKRDFEMSLKSLSDMDGLSTESQARLNAAINEIRLILEANPNSKIKFENGDFKLEVKENGMIKFDSRDGKDDDDSEDDNRGHGNDDDREDDDNPGNSGGVNVNVGAGVNLGTDVREDDNEVFCRGEWRDPEDCDSNSNDDDNEDDDNSGSGNGNDHDPDHDDNSGSGNDDDNDSDDEEDNDDDNSGRGN